MPASSPEPAGRDTAYHIEESRRGAGQDLFLTGTGEVGLMGFRSGEILDAAELPLQYATVSTCFRREAGAAGKDTAGLYRIHQFDKCEQVVICRAYEAESRRWHARMIGIVEELLPRRVHDASRNAVFQAMLGWEEGSGVGGSWTGVMGLIR